MSVIKVGDKIGPYTFLGWGEKRQNGRRLVVVRCFCGEQKHVQFSNARRSKSCGCLTKDILRAARTTHGHAKLFGIESPTYKSWKSMIDRCTYRAHKSYNDYGGRGITICERWLKFDNFLADMGERPRGHTLGRINNDGNYEPGNCIWETFKEQANNRRNSVNIMHRGVVATLAQWAEKTGLSYCALQKRLAKGWSIEKTLTTPARRQKNARGTWLKPLRAGYRLKHTQLRLAV